MNKLTQNLLKLSSRTQTLRHLTSQSFKPAKLSHSEYGDPEKGTSPFVILHGLLGSKQNWSSLCKLYAQKFNPSRKVIAVDLRNHGESEHSPEHTYDHMVEDLKQFLHQQKINKLTLMGHSMGGRCSMLFAVKYPEFVEKLIVVDISPIGRVARKDGLKHILTVLNGVEMPRDMPQSKAGRFLDEQLAKEFDSKDERQFFLTNLKPDGSNGYKWRANIPVLLKNLEHIADFHFPDKQFTGETLFIGGGNSDFLPRSDYPRIQKLFPNSQLKYIEGAGHWVHAEKPNEFFKVTMDFLAKK